MIPPTAFTAAAARAAHLVVDGEPRLFADPAAEVLLGEHAAELLRYHREHGEHPVLRSARVQTTVRSRFTEDRLAASGLAQYVLLGAGLDSFAHRNSLGVRVFEVDRPGAQEWKRGRLPGEVTYVPVDFESDDLPSALRKAGFSMDEPAFVAWLGVTMYLSATAIDRTLAALGELARGSQLTADYLVPPELRAPEAQAYVDAVAAMTAERGEPWRTCLSPQRMAELLAAHGFRVLTDASQREGVDPALWQREDGLTPGSLSRLVHAELR
ncbi:MULTISPECIES: class I SAM-dependent methyltransferase [Amycolatopsis]|uniref:S-adenosyl-L-methionine-dependent methyltransferase n=2 Tax=Amycolatopsis TaxID=1813 RepID=A0A1I3UGX0_9PSEU|nr:class I SAM-dependent methyltransferase [Amycolatopsis sacchari]SFJ82300.1 methyltransferase, TIGR00027 family [Amycolatopsis sacchari]